MTTRTDHGKDGLEPAPPRKATVLESLTNGLFRLQLTDGLEMTAHAAKDLRKVFTRLLPGDQVMVEVSPFDPSRGRICNLVLSRQQQKPHQSHRSQPQQREQS
ncbi:MAG: hypothetical protein JNK78_08675 [Planctomycetes bacterium]|nr:hypothetical protein [Planctomycetota bacterium]